MRTAMKKTTMIFCLLLSVVTKSQVPEGYWDNKYDSLKKAYRIAKDDTTRCYLLTEIIGLTYDGNQNKRYNDTMLLLAEGNLKKNSPFPKAYKRYLADAYNNIGCQYASKGIYEKAINELNKAIKLYQWLGENRKLSICLSNLAYIHSVSGDKRSAKSINHKALDIAYQTKDSTYICSMLISLGDLYKQIGNNDSAMTLFNKALLTAINNDDEDNESSCYATIAELLKSKGDYQNAIEYQKKLLKINTRNKDTIAIGASLSNIGNYLGKMGKFKEALPYALKGYQYQSQYGTEYGNIGNVRWASNTLYQIYKGLGQMDKALEMYETSIRFKDSLDSQENRKAVISYQIKSEYEKKSLADSLRSDNEKNKILMESKAEIERRENQKIALFIGLALVIIFSAIVFNRFQLTKKQKQVIEHHQKEITDSINYAKRLQEAILPNDYLFKNLLSDSFVLYKPKDIVAGDFYWLESVGNLTFVAAADCTGHGVPGAMVSMVCSNALTRVVLEYGVTEPGEILDEVRKIVIATFEKSGMNIKDGMDISLCVFNRVKYNEVKWAGANNPLWIVDSGNITEIKADKQPIGKCDNPKPFTTHTLNLKGGSSVYLFTDGYADQFGGEKGKKFMYKRMKEIILEHSGELMLSQKMHLDVAFDNWVGGLEQVDDVCVIGIRI